MFKGIFYTKKKGETIMAELESLDIRIDSTTASASKKIDDLIAKVGGLETAFTRIDDLHTTNLSNQLRVLGTSLQTFKQGGLTGRELSTIASGLQKIASVDSNGLRNTASAIQQVASAIQSMNNASRNSGGISAFARSISRIVPLANASGNIATLGASLRTFVNDLNSVPQTTFDATSLTASINAISRLGGKNSRSATTTIPLLTHAMKNFVVEMNKVGDLQSGSQNLHSLANAISILGRKTSEKAITNIPQLAKALNEMMVVLSKSPRVSDNLINMTNALAKLSANGVKATGTVNGLTKSYRIFGNHTRSLNKHSKGLASTIGMLYARFWVLFRAFRLLGSAVKYASDLIEVQNVIDNTFGVSTTKAINSNADAIQHMSKNTISWFGMSELTTKTIAGRYMAMGSAMGLANKESDGLSKHLSSLMGDMGKVTNKASEMALNITALAGDMASFYNVDASEMSEKLASGIYSGQVRALRAYGLDLTMATLQEYAMSRGITENVKNMTQAEKTLLRYNYVMERTQNVQGDFVRTQGTWANQTRMLKQNLQQLGSVIGDVMIHALKGFVTWTNKALLSLTGFAVEVANALGKIFGWTIETSGGSTGLDDLTDDTEDIADGFGDATSKAKEFKNVLQGFDKLNLITTPSDSGSGKGSGAGVGGSQLSDWDIKKTDGSLMKTYESEIANLGDLGYMIQDKMSDAMERIDWQKIYLKAKGFGSGLANFLNGLLTPRLFGEIGDTLGGGLNTAIYTGLSFVETFNWAQAGKALSAGINKFFRKVDWKSSGKLLGKFINGIFTSLNNFFKATNWKRLGKSFNDFISNAIKEINWKLLAKTVLNGYKALLDFGGVATGTGKAFGVITTSALVMFGAFKGYKAISNTVKSIKSLSTAIRTSSIALKLGELGVSMSTLGTAGVALAGVLGGVALFSFINYRVECEKAKREQELLNKAWGNDKDRNAFLEDLENMEIDLDTLKERIKNAKTEMATSIQGGEGETQYINDLIDNYYKLQTQTNLTTKEKKNMLEMSKKLVSYFPELQNYYDAEKGLISKTKNEVKKLNQARLEEIKTNAMEDLLTEEYKAYYESLSNVETAYKDLTKAQKVLDDYTKSHSKRIALAKDEYEKIIPSVEEYSELLNPLQKGVKMSSDTISKLTSVLKRLNKYGWSGDNLQDFNDLLKDMEDGSIDSEKSLNALYESLNIYNSAIAETKDEYEDYRITVSGMNKDVEKAKKTYDGYAKEINKIVDTVKEYGNQVGISDTKLQKANAYIQQKFPGASAVFSKVEKSILDVASAYGDMFAYNGKTVTTSTKIKGATAVPTLLSGLNAIKMYDDLQVTTYYKNKTSSGSQSPKGFLDILKSIFSYNGKTIDIKSKVVGGIANVLQLIGKADGGVFNNGSWHPIPQYASGGVPDMGQMFIARESGPELVGTLGGHSAVMNNDQIVASVSNGVYQAVKSALGNGQNVTVNVTLQGDADGLFTVVQNKNSQYKKINGHSAF